MNRATPCTATIALAVLLAAAPARADDPVWIAHGKHAMVAADSAAASAIGRDILRAGGNAVDAAVAVSFAVGVARPYSTGPAGGGFTIVRFADGRVVSQDCRERAPAKATADMYVKAAPYAGALPPSNYGHLAVAIPGLVAGRCKLLKQYGTMSLEQVIKPAAELAEKGVTVDEHFKEAIDATARRYDRYPTLRETCPYVFHTFLNNGHPPAVGDTIRQPALARLLRGIGKGGAAFFYQGPVADAIDIQMKKRGGVLSKADLANYLATGVVEREPLLGSYHGLSIITMPSPSSGGIALLESLNILSNFDLPKIHQADPVAAVHLQIEAMKNAFADRAHWLGDADFLPVPTQRLISPDYARDLARQIDVNATRPVDQYGMAQIPDDAGTSHFCIVDEAGNVVVSTETINTNFGSLAAVDEFGLILNDEMDDFVSHPGKPNVYGLIQSERNEIAPGKRPLSSMAPTIALKNGKPVLMLGASGGPRIISSVLDVFLALTDYGDTPEQAMLRLRPHHQWRPDEVAFDDAVPPVLVDNLTQRGHKVSGRRKTGMVQAIIRKGDEWVGMSDPRKGGRPAGY